MGHVKPTTQSANSYVSPTNLSPVLPSTPSPGPPLAEPTQTLRAKDYGKCSPVAMAPRLGCRVSKYLLLPDPHNILSPFLPASVFRHRTQYQLTLLGAS